MTSLENRHQCGIDDYDAPSEIPVTQRKIPSEEIKFIGIFVWTPENYNSFNLHWQPTAHFEMSYS